MENKATLKNAAKIIAPIMSKQKKKNFGKFLIVFGVMDVLMSNILSNMQTNHIVINALPALLITITKATLDIGTLVCLIGWLTNLTKRKDSFKTASIPNPVVVDLLEQMKSLRWGIPKAEYKKIFSDKKWDTDEHPTLNAAGFFDEYLNHQFFMVGYFLDGSNKLAKVEMGLGSDTPDEQLGDVYKKIVANLSKTYGDPQFSKLSDEDEQKTHSAEHWTTDMKVWKTKDSIITGTLILRKFGLPDPCVNVSWGDIENDPASRRWAQSELSDGRKPEKLPKDFKLSEAQISEIKRAMENDK